MTTLPPLAGAAVDPACVQAVEDAAVLLRSLGHEVVEADPPWGEDRSLLRTFTAVFGPAVCSSMAMAAALRGREVTAADVEPLSWAVWSRCRELDATSALLAEFRLHGVARKLVTWMDGYDAILTPSLAEPPLPLGTLDPLDAEDPWGTFARSGRFTPFTAVFNVTGQPAVSLPLFQHADGLPLGVQLAGRPTGEGDLLALAAQLEDAAPWADRRPSL
jgi:amidase